MDDDVYDLLNRRHVFLIRTEARATTKLTTQETPPDIRNDDSKDNFIDTSSQFSKGSTGGMLRTGHPTDTHCLKKSHLIQINTLQLKHLTTVHPTLTTQQILCTKNIKMHNSHHDKKRPNLVNMQIKSR